MIYILSHKIRNNIEGFWKEGNNANIKIIYNFGENEPPVSYFSYELKAHSLTHCESEKHVVKDSISLDKLLEKKPEYFVGNCLLLKFKKNFNKISENKLLQIIELGDFLNKINALNLSLIPQKILFTLEEYPTNEYGYHHPDYILLISEELARYLVVNYKLNLYGTSWISTDYQPNSKERPIHKILLRNGVIFECLNLLDVPEGFYFFCGIPNYLDSTSESAVTPVLINQDYIAKENYLSRIKHF